MPDNLQGNIGVHEPLILMNLDAEIVANGAFFPNDAFTVLANAVPYRTHGWTKLFVTIAADQTLAFRVFGGRQYVEGTNRLTRVNTWDQQLSHADPTTLANVISDEFEITTPFIVFDIQNTGGNPTTYLDIYIGLRV